jgi:hypothetical protein
MLGEAHHCKPGPGGEDRGGTGAQRKGGSLYLQEEAVLLGPREGRTHLSAWFQVAEDSC